MPNNLSYYSRLCEKELKRSRSDVECVMSRKIMGFDAPAMRWMASATSEVAIEL